VKPATAPKQYVIQKKVVAASVIEALQLAELAPVESVFVDASQPETKVDAIGFKTVPVPE
jgi:hypothetical protein